MRCERSAAHGAGIGIGHGAEARRASRTRSPCFRARRHARRSAGRAPRTARVHRGEAGVGKTVLVRRFCAEHGDSLRIVWGACEPLFTPRPLGPFVDIAQATGGELEELVTSGARPHEVAAALARELGEPAILVIEDVHWADEASLDVLRLTARKIATVPGLALVTYRDDSLDRVHPLRTVLGELAADPAVARLRLEPLSPQAVAQLAAPYGVDADGLYRTTDGNPFFVTEVLASGDGEIPHPI
jgi:predicted ATPase